MYQTIYIYETLFQKSIIDFIVENEESDNSNYLIIDGLNHKLRVNDDCFPINFNKIDRLRTSVQSLNTIKELDLSCETIVCTHFTGINALFLSALIKAKKKVLIDDGIGTPVIIQEPKLFSKKYKYRLRFFLVKTSLLFYGVRLKNIEQVINSINEYWTVYNSNSMNSNMKIKRIDFFNKSQMILKGKTCFIGAPMMDFGLVSVDSYKQLLQSVGDKFGTFVYYPHPDEKKINDLNIDGIEVKQNNTNIEDAFNQSGVPQTVIGFTSSALLNLSNCKYEDKKPHFFYIKKEVYGTYKDQLYYDVLERNGINNFVVNYL